MLYSLSVDQVSTSLGQESVVLNHNKGEYYSLNELGTFIWGLLSQGAKTKEDIVDSVLEEYDIDELTCVNDVEALLEELQQEKLIVGA
ncbi:MAG: PqqD family protein [Leadbetterella sp.]